MKLSPSLVSHDERQVSKTAALSRYRSFQKGGNEAIEDLVAKYEGVQCSIPAWVEMWHLV